MRVLHILGELRPSGAEVMLANAASLWERYGITCEILSIGSNVGSYAANLESAGYRIHHIAFNKSLGYLREFRLFVEREQFDVIHIHAERAYFAHAVIARLCRVPLLLRSTHNCFVFPAKTRIIRGLERRVAKGIGVIQYSVSPSVRDTEWEQFRNATQVLPNWYNSGHFRPPTHGERVEARKALGIQDEFVLASVSNASPVKNLTAILAAIADLEPDNPIVYLNVGRVTSVETEMADELGLGDRVRFCGIQTDPLPFLWAADAFVMPSFHEGFSIAALEATATGLIPVLSNVRGLRDLGLLDGLCIEWSGTDFASVRDAILRVRSWSAEDRRLRGLRNHEIVKRGYSLENGVAGYAAVYLQEYPSPQSKRGGRVA